MKNPALIPLALLLVGCIPTAPDRERKPAPCELERAPGTPISGGLGDSTATPAACPSEAQ